MSRVSDLIKKLCPNGVEYLELYKITKWNKRFNGVNKKWQTQLLFTNTNVSAQELKSLLANDGNIKLLSTGNFDGYTTSNIYKGIIDDVEVISIPSGGSANIKYYNGKFINSGNILGTTNDKNMYCLKYIYYYLINNINTIQNYFRGSSVQHPDMNQILQFKIPIPPIEVQEEIVKILDKFVELKNELEIELKIRKVQYDFCCINIFNNKEKLIPISDLLDKKGYIRGPFGSALVKSDMVKYGIPVYEQQHAICDHRNFRYFITSEKAKKLSRFSVKCGDLIISCSGTVGKVSIINNEDPMGIINQALLILRLNNHIIMPKYMKYYLESPFGNRNITANTNKSAQINIASRESIEKIKIPVPNIKKQAKIVEKLDKFYTMINSVTEGIPAEIELRKKQYEYYRNKLLNFEELKNE